MNFKAVKTKQDIIKEQGLPIWLAKITIIPAKGKKYSWIKKVVEIVYKKRKLNDMEDDFLISTIARQADLKKENLFTIKSIEKIKQIGTGIYEC